MSRQPWISAGLLLLLLTPGRGFAQFPYLYETAYLPTSTILSTPVTTSYLTTSTIVPTSYSYTPYLPTAPYAPSYVTTSRFRSRRLFERTSYYGVPTYSSVLSEPLVSTSYVVPRSILSTSSYVPTTFITSSSLLPTSYVLDSGLIATSATFGDSACCESSPAVPTVRRAVPPTSAATQGASSAQAVISKPTGTAASAPERAPSATINEGMADDRGDSTVKPPVKPAPTQIQSGPQPAVTSTPAAPTPADTGTPPTPPIIDPSGVGPLPAPGDLGPTSPRPNETGFRSVKKPSSYELRNVLKGRVVSSNSGQPEEGVTVILSNRNSTFIDRTAKTDADGDFKLSLPEGDWTVKVEMPSGRIAAVGRDFVTATSGRVVDPSGHDVRQMTINR